MAIFGRAILNAATLVEAHLRAGSKFDFRIVYMHISTDLKANIEKIQLQLRLSANVERAEIQFSVFEQHHADWIFEKRKCPQIWVSYTCLSRFFTSHTAPAAHRRRNTVDLLSQFTPTIVVESGSTSYVSQVF